MQKIDIDQKSITKKCFDYLARAGVPVFQECAKIPLLIRVRNTETGRSEVDFLSTDIKERKIYIFDIISERWFVLNLENLILKKLKVGENFLGAYEVYLLKAWGTKIFYTLKNFWERLGYNLTEGNFEFGIRQNSKGSLIGLTGLIDEKFWKVSDLQKNILLDQEKIFELSDQFSV